MIQGAFCPHFRGIMLKLKTRRALKDKLTLRHWRPRGTQVLRSEENQMAVVRRVGFFFQTSHHIEYQYKTTTMALHDDDNWQRIHLNKSKAT